ncbi:NAD(P)H-dependent oxidoreductase [Seonamhaeicola marinus]|uniref:NAD(P)H-dependent oxidoreductase n=1 Tax=Seonamhaeicola marinus TaxID=1912246 RepID=UPI001FE40CEE|nr:NAD(P)H-dependent oxidoreductase [Seonamhaeicola marinus]
MLKVIKKNGVYESNGRIRSNLLIKYGTGGLMKGKKYILTICWNTAKTAFNLEYEFFNQTSVDEGDMFGFHKMNAFTGMQVLGTYHFHDMDKNANVPLKIINYKWFK